jgi:hypothetical protein
VRDIEAAAIAEMARDGELVAARRSDESPAEQASPVDEALPAEQASSAKQASPGDEDQSSDVVETPVEEQVEEGPPSAEPLPAFASVEERPVEETLTEVLREAAQPRREIPAAPTAAEPEPPEPAEPERPVALRSPFDPDGADAARVSAIENMAEVVREERRAVALPPPDEEGTVAERSLCGLRLSCPWSCLWGGASPRALRSPSLDFALCCWVPSRSRRRRSQPSRPTPRPSPAAQRLNRPRRRPR